ncbi:MAG: hypothetical protein C5B48_06010 [Candidatus Rokuibacteriota bacterium]|nr:MAG: hypothetical protein C5B48_06010 [Candidatus Rokubacteria bacterium]
MHQPRCSRLSSHWGLLLAPHVCLLCLGGFQLREDSGALLTLPSKVQALLAYLAMTPGRRHSRDKLGTFLWPNAGDEQARQSLRQALVMIRRVFGTRAVLFADHQVVALEGTGLDVDVVRFEALVAQGSVEALEQAVELYQGNLLEGIRVKEPPFDEWLLGERERLRESALGVLARLLAHQKSGPSEPAIRTALRILAIDSANEATHRELMRLFERQGRRGEALRQYRLCVDALQRELGVEPQQETRRLYQDVVRAEQVPPAHTHTSLAADGATTPSASRPADEPEPESARLIGRDAELARLFQALDATCHGTGSLVVILGEAGIGKSSLVETLGAEARRRRVRNHVGRSYPSEQVLAFAPWIEALRADAARDPNLVASLGPAWIDELSRLFPDLETGPRGRARESVGAQRLFEAVTRLVSYLAGVQPRLIMFEDAHWADEMSLRLLAFVARRIASARVLVVATVREEELSDTSILSGVLGELAADPRVERMTLPPLSREHTAALVRSLARADTDAAQIARLADEIFASSRGNPFMVVETMRALADGTTIARATSPVLPERVRQLIASRIERLDEQCRNLLATASVIGRDFEFALLRHAAGLGEADAAERTETLVRRRVLRVVGERFDFVHEQVRDVAYGKLLPPRRALLHAAVARAIEQVHAGRLDEHVEQLAHHSFLGAVWDRAVVYGRQAGAIAAERSASAQAAGCFDQALKALAHLPENPERLSETIDLLQFRGAAQFGLEDRAGVLQSSEEAVALAERLGDPARLARAVGHWANALWFAGENRRALDVGRRAVALADAIDDPVPRITNNLNLGMICITAGDHRGAVRLLTTAVALLTGDLERQRLGRTLYPSVTARGELARAQAELGEFGSAKATIDDAIRIAEAVQHSTTRLVARVDACHVLLCRGEFTGAITTLEACLEALREGGSPAWAGSAAAMLGYARAMTGRYREGIPPLRQALEQVAQGRRTREALFTTYLSEALHLAQESAEASTLAERALALSRERFEQANEARALYLLGGIGVEQSGGDGPAERHYRDALTLAEGLGLRPLVAQCHLGLAKLGRIRNEPQTRQKHLAVATTMFSELDMPFWLDRAATEGSLG